MIFLQLVYRAARAGRLSSFLKGELKMSTGLINRLKWGDAIRVNDVPQHTDFAVQPDDVITVRLDEPAPAYPAEAGRLTILFEDDHMLAVDKPAGMLIHPSHSQNTGTLANLVLGYYAQTGQESAFHPVTRLDRDTFGVTLLAKNSHIHALLQNADVQKIYHALVFGGPEAENGIIDAPIARRPLPSLLREIAHHGKPSVTEYSVLERMEQTTLLALKPITGRTHQLRLHCAHMGYPILGDPQYGSEESKAFSERRMLAGQLLCAKYLVLNHPVTGQPLRLESSLDVML